MRTGTLVSLKNMNDWEMYGGRENGKYGIILGVGDVWDFHTSQPLTDETVGYRVLWHDGHCDVYWEYELQIISEVKP